MHELRDVGRASLQLVPRQPFVLREQTAQQTRPRGFCSYMESFLRDLLRPPRRSLRPVRISPPARAAAAAAAAATAAFPCAATLPCAPDRSRAAHRDGRRHALADRAAAAQAVAAPPRPNPSARACRCRRRRRSTRCPCVVRVALCMCVCMYVVCVWTYVTLEPLSMIVDRYSGLDGSGGPRRRLVTDSLKNLVARRANHQSENDPCGSRSQGQTSK